MLKDDRLEKKLKFLSYYKDLPVQKLAAGFIGVHEDTIVNWKKEDTDFSDHIELAKSEWVMKTAKRVRNPEWLLERLIKDHFTQKLEVELSDPEEHFKKVNDLINEKLGIKKDSDNDNANSQ